MDKEIKEEEFVKADEVAEATDAAEAPKAEENASETKAKAAKKETKNKQKEEIEKLKAEIEQLKNDKLKMKDDYVRAYAELENTRRRLNDDALQTKKYASQKVLEQLINPIDMLIKVCSFEQSNPEVNNFLMGFKMISNQLTQILESEGVKEIKSTGEKFDPKCMQAMATVETNDSEEDTVVETMQAGFMYKDRVLRPAMVKVAKPIKEKEIENTEE